MGTPYALTPHGTPPVCTSLDFLRWRDAHIEFRLAECPIPRGTTRYVDFTLGNDSNNGTIGSPWKTVARVNDAVDAASTDAELSILFKRGEVWRMSGLTGLDAVGKNLLTIGSYGVGWRPNFTWFEVLSAAGWSLTSGEAITYERTEASSVAWVREQNSFDSVLVKRGSVEAVEDNPGSWYWDGSKLYISARSAKSPYTHVLPTNSGLLYEVVYNNTGYGIAVTGDSVRIDNLRVDGAGCVTTAQNNGGYGIWWAPVNPTDCCVISDSEAYYNQAHNIGTTTVSNGGIFTVVNCRAGWMSGTATASGATSGTVYVSYAGNGGQEALWVGNCNAAGNLPAAAVAYGTLNSAAGILMHCSGDNRFSLGLGYGNYNDTPEYQVQSVAGFAGAPSFSDLADCRSWIMDSKFRVRDANAADAAFAGVVTIGHGLVGDDGVAINCHTEVRCVRDNDPSGAGRYIGGFAAQNQVLINNVIDLDWLDNVPFNTQPRALWYGATNTNVECYNSMIATRVRGRAWASIGFIAGASIKLFNCHLISYSPIMRLRTGNNVDQLKNNEYANFWPGFKSGGSDGWDGDVTRTEDTVGVFANRVSSESPLLSANQHAVKGYTLEYDFYENPRIVAATARGPVEASGGDAVRFINLGNTNILSRESGQTLMPVVGETVGQSITLYQQDKTTPLSLAGKDLSIVFETLQGVDVAVVSSGSISISGDDYNVITFTYPAAVTLRERNLKFAVRDSSAPRTMYLQGLCVVTKAPQVD
jgi:hypothetical protein